MSNRINYEQWVTGINNSNPKYRPLFAKDKTFPPIFFFGNPKGAVAATIGINPSAKEFRGDRKWSSEYNDLFRLLERCRSYFKNPEGVPPYERYFGVWKRFLQKTGVSYDNSPRAVHLDFSPRATRSMSSLLEEPEQRLFVDLVKNDLRYLILQLKAYTHIKYLYLAGTVTKKFWAINILKERLSNKMICTLPFKSLGQKKPYVGLYKLHLGGILRYLFFCSTSPSAQNPGARELLIQRGSWLAKHHPEFLPSNH